MKNMRYVILFVLFVKLVVSSNNFAMQAPLSAEQYTAVAQSYQSLEGLSGAPIDWQKSISDYFDANPWAYQINPITQISPRQSATIYMSLFTPSNGFRNRVALFLVILELLHRGHLPPYMPPVVAVYEPTRLRFYHEMRQQLLPPCF
jgi:hypothetical protein